MKKLFLFFIFNLLHSLLFAQEKINLPILDSFNTSLVGSMNIKYNIDPKIRNSMDKFITNQGNYNYQSMLCGSSKDKAQRNDWIVLKYRASGDTINIVGFYKMSVTAGFRIIIIGDSCNVHFYSFTDSANFRFNENEPIYKDQILVPPLYAKVILAKKPGFKLEEEIEGYIEFECLPFFLYRKDQSDDKLKYFLSGYFRTNGYKKEETEK